MKLPFSKKEKLAYYLGLLLRDEKAYAVVFEEENGKVNIIGQEEAYFTDSIETASFEELLEVLDKAISTAERSLPEGIETQKTIFGVKDDWVVDSKIKKEYLAKLKKVCDELGLSPIGFLVITEAIAHLLQKEEGAPVSAILIDIGRKNITVSLLRAGKVVESKAAPISESIAKTTDILLHHFTSYDVLPSRIIVLGSHKETEHLSQEFNSHSWSNSLPFLHVPTITSLKRAFDAQAVLVGAASQMGFEVLGGGQTAQIANQSLEKDDNTPKSRQEGGDQTLEEAISAFGFVKEQDVASIKHTPSLDNAEEEEKEYSQAFIVHRHQDEGMEDAKHAVSKVPEEVHAHTPIPGEKKKLPFSWQSFTSRLGFVSGAISFLKQSFAKLPVGKKFVLIPPLVVLLAIGALLFYLFGLKAHVVLHMAPKHVSQDEKITLSSDAKTDIAGHTIGAEIVSVAKDESSTTQATGKKEVGDKAKGTVTILSSLTSEQNIPAGTVVTAANGLLFVLDNDVKIASSSGVSDIKSVAAGVSAKDIGKDYNLPSGAKFSVGTFDKSSVEAKNDSAFSGGNKKEVIVVAKADIAKLEEELTKNNEADAKDALKKQLSADKALVPGIVNTIVSDKQFDKKVGDETQNVTGKAKITFEALAYKKDDMNKLSESLLKNSQSNDVVSSGSPSYELTDIKRINDKQEEAILHVTSSLLPAIDSKKLAKDVSGQSFENATIILSKTPQVTKITITLSPNIPFLPKKLPNRVENIVIEKANE